MFLINIGTSEIMPNPNDLSDKEFGKNRSQYPGS